MIWLAVTWVYIYIKVYTCTLKMSVLQYSPVKRGGGNDAIREAHMYTHTHIKSERTYIIKQQCLVDFRCSLYG